eukprot:scaffold775_cov274-Pinguiococcus_pyrenoidosus.AAC.5
MQLPTAVHCSSKATSSSFPFDGSRRLRRDVVGHSIDAGHLIDDACADPSEDLIRHMIPIRRHVVRGRDRAHGNRVLVRTTIAHHSNTSDRQEDAKRLTDLVVEAGCADFLMHDSISLPQLV